MQFFLMVALIVVLLTPLLLVCGLPFIAAGVLFYRHTTLWLAERTRFVLACGVASLGIAPSFDQFWLPTSIYLAVAQGEEVGVGAALLSFAVTWLLVTLQAAKLLGGRRQYA